MTTLKKAAVAAAALSLLCSSTARAAFSPDSLARRFGTYAAWCSPEKLYVHIDRTYYTAGETIWFTGWLRNASAASVHPESNYIYAELLDGNGTAAARVKVRRDGAGFPGHIDLPESFATGEYTFRAYTLWQLNRPLEYMFNQKIRILGAKDAAETKKAAPADGIDLSFWPEGGRYFAGARSVIGFKAMDKEGRSVDFTGWLAEDGGEAVLPVSTRHDGMGVLEFYPKEGVGYHVETESGQKFPLPAPAASGATINLRHFQGHVFTSVRGTGGVECSLLVRDNDEIRPIANVTLDGKARTFKAEEDFFSEGINHMILVDSEGTIISERLFFIYGRKDPACDLTVYDKKPAARALVGGNLSLEDQDGRPLDGDCSISVVRGSLRRWQQDEGIVSYMRLSSELNGHINDPDYYFDASVPLRERSDNLDLLMMVQGWRYYDLSTVFRTDGAPFRLKEIKEYTQSVHGKIMRRNSSKAPKKFLFSVFIPKLKARTTISVDEGTSFLLDSLEFEENTDFLINVGTSRIGTSYLPTWDGDTFAPSYAYFPAPGIAKKAIQEEEEKIPLKAEGPLLDTLSAAVVVAEPEDWDDVLTFGRTMSGSDLEAFKDRTLIEYLGFRMPTFIYNGENMYNRLKRRSSLMSEEDDEEGGTGGIDLGEEDTQGAVKLLVDDTQQSWWGYDMLRIDEIASISISTEPDPLWGGDGGIVSIKLKKDFSMSTIGRDPSLLYFVPLGYQKPKAFYSPRYDRGDTGPFDKRNTIFWSPAVHVSGGKALVPFCNTDQMDYPYYVRIEGITSAGQPFSRHCILDFKE